MDEYVYEFDESEDESEEEDFVPYQKEKCDPGDYILNYTFREQRGKFCADSRMSLHKMLVYMSMYFIVGDDDIFQVKFNGKDLASLNDISKNQPLSKHLSRVSTVTIVHQEKKQFPQIDDEGYRMAIIIDLENEKLIDELQMPESYNAVIQALHKELFSMATIQTMILKLSRDEKEEILKGDLIDGLRVLSRNNIGIDRILRDVKASKLTLNSINQSIASESMAALLDQAEEFGLGELTYDQLVDLMRHQ